MRWSPLISVLVSALPALAGVPLPGVAQEVATPLESWDSCLLVNGSFEEVVSDELREPGLAWWGTWGVPGWRPVDAYRRGWTSDPDLFTPERHQNFKGFQQPAHGENYAGFAFGGGRRFFFLTEAFGGRLRTALEPGRTYRVTAHISLAEENRQGNAPQPELHPLPRVELLFHAPEEPELPPIVVGQRSADDPEAWIRFETRITVPVDTPTDRYRELVLRGYRARGTELNSMLGYVYVDALAVCPVEP